MTRQKITETILREKLVVIIRTEIQEEVPLIVDALVRAKVKVMEITCNTPGFDREIKAARTKYPDVLIGAGTVISEELADQATKAGAQFFVTPGVQKEVASYAHQHNLPILMGALTPSEVSEAVSADADIIKIFPADILGIDYLKALMGPFDKVPFFAVGGIGNENAKAWIDAGAKGLGVGGKLTKLKGKDSFGIESAAKEMRNILGTD